MRCAWPCGRPRRSSWGCRGARAVSQLQRCRQEPLRPRGRLRRTLAGSPPTAPPPPPPQRAPRPSPWSGGSSSTVSQGIHDSTSGSNAISKVSKSVSDSLLDSRAHESFTLLRVLSLVSSQIYARVSQVCHSSGSSTHHKIGAKVADLWGLD